MGGEEWVDAFQGGSVADEAWLAAQVLGLTTNGSGPHVAPSWTPRNLAHAPDEPPVPPTLGGLNLLYPGKRHVFSGPQESAKTIAAYVVALSVIREGGRVLLIDFEMGELDAKRRFRELGASDDDLGLLDYVEPDHPLTPKIAGELVELEPSLVVIDASAGAYDLQGLDDNKRGDVERFGALYVRPFWREKIATLVIDHVVKNTEARGNYAIGSERKVGATDVHLGFTVIHAVKRGAHGRYQITTHKDRGGFHKRGKLATFELRSDPDSHAFDWEIVPAQEIDEQHPFRPTGIMEKVSRFLEIQPEPVSRNTVESAKLGKGEYVRIALDLLTDEGFLVESKGANRARLVSVQRVYRESDDIVQNSHIGSSLGSSQFVPESEESSSSVRPSPYGGRTGRTDLEGRDEPQPELPNDGIPF